MKIGVINQVDDIEKRVLLTPSDVGKLIKQGHSVYIESDSGSGAFFPDNLYTDVGAFIANGSDIFNEPDVILSLNSNAISSKSAIVCTSIHSSGMATTNFALPKLYFLLTLILF